MPGKLDDASNLRFLHACLLSSDYSRIDFARVAQQHGIQPPAARMRFARLNVALGGKPKARKRVGSEATTEPRKKTAKEGLEYHKVRDDGGDEEDLGVGKVEEEEVRIKKEDAEDWPAEATEMLQSQRQIPATPMGPTFPSPQMDGRAIGYAYPQPNSRAYPVAPQGTPYMPYFSQQMPMGYPQTAAASPRPSFSLGQANMAEKWSVDEERGNTFHNV